MPYDQSRYRDLISRAAFDASFYKGTIQDVSPNGLAMSFSGAPTWARINGWPALSRGASNGTQSTSAVAYIIDATQAAWFEFVILPSAIAVSQNLWVHAGAGNVGGHNTYYEFANTRISLSLYDNAGALARYFASPTGSCPRNIPSQIILGYATGGASGVCWINGIPGTVALAGAGVPANFAGTRTLRMDQGAVEGIVSIVRAWQGTPSNEDAACLAEAARELVGGW